MVSFVFLKVFATIPANAENTDWSTYGYDLARTHYYPYPAQITISDNFEELWTLSGRKAVLTGDINNNDLLEVVFTDGSALKAYNNEGTELWSTSTTSSINLIADVTGDGVPEIITSLRNGGSLELYIYDNSGNYLKTLSRPGGYDSGIRAFSADDYENDGNIEILVHLNAGYSRDPRGVSLFDYETGLELWYYDVGPSSSFAPLGDINEDGIMEIVVGGGTWHNGASGSGVSGSATPTTDGDLYSIVFTADTGQEIFTNNYFSDGQYNGFVDHAIVDLNHDLNSEILSFEGHSHWYPGTLQIHQIDKNGVVLNTWNGPYVNGIDSHGAEWAVADFNDDGYDEIVVKFQNQNNFVMLDHNLNQIISTTLNYQAFSMVANDINGDGSIEILLSDMTNHKLRIFDSALNELWNFDVTGIPYYLAISDLNNDGINEIIIPADNLYILTSMQSDDEVAYISTEWEDEIDEMVVPYDKVDLKFTFKNNLQTSLNNVNVIFNSNSDLISLENENINIGSVAPGDEFSVINSIIVAGVENSQIMNEIIDSSGSGELSLSESIDVELEYNSESIEFLKITPKDENNNPLYIQYPNFYTDPYLEDTDEDIDYYMQGDDDFSHGECVDTNHDGNCDETPNYLVRKYAVEAAAYFSIFPDNPEDVSFNVFRYVDDKLDKDKDPAPYAYNDDWIVDELNLQNDLSNLGWICIPQAYLFTSFERTLGFPSREITTAEGTHMILPYLKIPYIGYYQNAASEVWYDGSWNYYDPWTSQSTLFGYDISDNILSFDDILTKTPIIKFKAWYGFNKQTSKTFNYTEYKGHNFSINPLLGFASRENQWKMRTEGWESGNSYVIIAGSPIEMFVRDNQGRMVGSTESGIVNEIPFAKYMPPGQIGHSNRGDPSTSFELDEFISLPEGLTGNYELIVKGTGDGEYTLVFANFEPSSNDEYSGVTTLTETLKKDDIIRYEINIGDSAINPVLPVNIDIKPGSYTNSINLYSKGKVPVAILSSGTFDARTVNISTINFAGAGVNLKRNGMPMVGIEDVNGDSLLDMIVHINTEALQLTLTDTEGLLEGKTIGGTPIRGTDSVRILLQ